VLIGKAGAATTSVCTANAESITVRGYDLCLELMGEKTFTDFFYLSMTGELPTDQQRYFVDLLLISIAEHGLTKEEVEDVLLDEDIILARSRSSGQPLAIGYTATGRRIAVVFEEIDQMTVRPITAYEVDD
jgi:uncharacterized DUF497 family protein